jgi:hypothetical protein
MLSGLSSFTSVNQENVNISYMEVLGGDAILDCWDTPLVVVEYIIAEGVQTIIMLFYAHGQKIWLLEIQTHA